MLRVVRSQLSTTVVKIEFDENIVKFITKPTSSQSEDSLSFSLAKKEHKTKPKQPDYSGTFTLPTDIILKAGVKYIYGGWIQTDLSINLKFTPLANIVSVQQTDIENEPKLAKDILSEMYPVLSFDN